jgi:TetR/AcrR family transcriptional repressor of nem operon
MTARPASTADQILDISERIVQARGFNGFSYGDVAVELGLTTAGVHYHFAGKGDLGLRLVERYTERFFAALLAIEANAGGAPGRLAAYVRIFEDVVATGRMCLCGILTAEYDTLSEPMRRRLTDFFERNEAWLAAQLAAGRESGELRFAADPRTVAAAMASALEGAMLVARAHGGLESFRASARLMLQNLLELSNG